MLRNQLKKWELSDVRPKAEYEHQLGLCVQPIFLFAEFPVLIQFFEHWLQMGATKFYIYRNSYSNEVNLVFRNNLVMFFKVICFYYFCLIFITKNYKKIIKIIFIDVFD